MGADEFKTRKFQIGQVFTPGSPVNERDLFAGRTEQTRTIIDAISRRGFHAVLYGDRGVGKTSLVNVLVHFLRDLGVMATLPRANCDATDNFTSLWKKVFADIAFTHQKPGVGFNAGPTDHQNRLVDSLPDVLRPDDVRRVLQGLAAHGSVVVAIDEFDRLADKQVSELMADTIKVLSDTGVAATILLIGVADTVDDLIAGHRSIERSLVQIPMPRMSPNETEQIVSKGVERLGMKIDKDALTKISSLSQGLPYITHMLALHSGQAALHRESLTIDGAAVETGIQKSVDEWQQSIVTSYYNATLSHQPDHLYKEVLLACALADVDEKGFFSAASVRAPLRIISRPNLDIPNFARHLKEFSTERRGEILTRDGEARRLRYRFVSPLMRPYIIMRGVKEGLLPAAKMTKIQQSRAGRKR